MLMYYHRHLDNILFQLSSYIQRASFLTMVRDTVLLFLLLPVMTLVYGHQNNSTQAINCTKGWFGKDCMYRCRCDQDSDCGTDGSCSPELNCLAGYFGPACQYENLLYKYSHEDTPKFVRDNNIQICNADSKGTVVPVKLQTEFSFNWVRVVLRNDGTKLQMALKMKGDQDCPNERRFIISTTIVDITCHTYTALSFFSLTGSGVSEICEVYISGGRNVALNQATNMSSAFNSTSISSAAVDGLPRNVNSTCAATTSEIFPSWQLDYNMPQMITWIKLFSTTQGPPNGLAGIKIYLLNDSDKVLITHKYTNYPSKLSAEAIVANNMPAKSLLVSAVKTQVNINERGLVLCEVETNGETLCPDNTYGLWCDRHCDCKPEEVCHLATGACSKGCNNGFYGINCSQPCGLRCMNKTCYQRLGSCVNCIAGYQGAYCDKVCEAGYYGVDCAKTCSKNCLSPCDPYFGGCTCAAGFSGAQCDDCPLGFYGSNCSSKCSKFCDGNCDVMTGHCTCLEGHYGSFCNECIAGFYGVNCSKPCPNRCKDKQCHSDTGMCIACKGDHIGPFCEGCPSRFFGSLCRYKCSAHCFNESCDVQNGTCPDCLDSYAGPQCIIAPKDRTKMFWFIVPSTIPIGMLTVSVIHFMKKKRSPVDEGEEDLSRKESDNNVFESEV